MWCERVNTDTQREIGGAQRRESEGERDREKEREGEGGLTVAHLACISSPH